MEHYGVDNEPDLRRKIYGTRSACSKEEVDLLKSYTSNLETVVYGEIGVYFGGTFRQMIDHISSSTNDFHCYGFDLFEDLEKETFGEEQTHDIQNKWNILNVAYRDGLDKTLEEMGCTNYTLVKGCSHETVSKIEDAFDLFFIDGNHTYDQCKKDFEAAYVKCKNGAVIVFDNSSNDIDPDPRYVELDGGPWKVCQELFSDDRVKFVEKVKRFTSFRVVK
tara:strand:- start:2162 stop:2821 length:660 start_codon:yes stop_codon:yes gene_type:complete